jgi:iron complex outermembrane receptor protein
MPKADVRNFSDYAAKVPNLTYSSGFGVIAGRTIAIRGVQGANTTGFYIDDMPVPSTLDPRVLDIERIEVLRGPQGTLYGARSMGGTVRLITETPDINDYSGKVHAPRKREIHGTTAWLAARRSPIRLAADNCEIASARCRRLR